MDDVQIGDIVLVKHDGNNAHDKLMPAIVVEVGEGGAIGCRTFGAHQSGGEYLSDLPYSAGHELPSCWDVKPA